jgi:outer membrane protein assembly factor BamB/DNA-binding XRE family transcriptional regulator
MATPNERLKNAREFRNLTQEKLAEEIGTNGRTVRNWEAGHNKPSLYYRGKLCEFFNKTMEELGFIEGEEKSSVQFYPFETNDGNKYPDQMQGLANASRLSQEESDPFFITPNSPAGYSIPQSKDTKELGVIDGEANNTTDAVRDDRTSEEGTSLRPTAFVSKSGAPQKQTDGQTSLSAPVFPAHVPRGHRLWLVVLLMVIVVILIGVGLGVVGKPLFRRINSIASVSPSPTFSPPPPYAPMFGFNAQHTRYNPNESRLSVANVSQLALDWTGSVGSTTSSSPTIANNVIYIGSDDGKLYAFSAAGCGRPSCAPLWTASTKGTVGSSPAIAGNVVYVGSDDYNLYAFDASSGRMLWTGPTDGGVTSSPVVANGTIYVGSFDHKLYAFNAAGCGKSVCAPLWTASTGSDIVSSPAFADNVVYVGSGDGKLYAFNAFGCGSGSCSPLWTTVPAGNSINSSPTVANGVVYVGSDDNKLYAFNATGCGQATCAPLWTSLPTRDSIFSSPAVANGVVYIGSRDGELRAFKAAGCGRLSCAPLWAAITDSSIFTSPSVANGVVYVGSDDHRLYAFNAAGCGQATTCAPLWTSPPTGNRIYSSTALISNGIVYIGSFDGNLYAFHLSGTTP